MSAIDDDPIFSELRDAAQAMVLGTKDRNWSEYAIIIAHPSAEKIIKHMLTQGAELVDGHAIEVVPLTNLQLAGVPLEPGRAHAMLCAGSRSAVVTLERSS